MKVKNCSLLYFFNIQRYTEHFHISLADEHVQPSVKEGCDHCTVQNFAKFYFLVNIIIRVACTRVRPIQATSALGPPQGP
jgi:hypothetical protein